MPGKGRAQQLSVWASVCSSFDSNIHLPAIPFTFLVSKVPSNLFLHTEDFKCVRKKESCEVVPEIF